MVKASAEEEFENIRNRCIHESENGEVGKMDEKQNKRTGDEREKGPARRPSF